MVWLRGFPPSSQVTSYVSSEKARQTFKETQIEVKEIENYEPTLDLQTGEDRAPGLPIVTEEKDGNS
jgi:hypothetical protein